MKNIIIGTTAINRPDLHSETIKGWYELIRNLDETKYNIKWVINIDVVSVLDFTEEETKNNLLEILEGIDVSFVNNNKLNPNFYSACQRLSKYIKLYSTINQYNPDDTVVFWLEDDWSVTKQVAPDFDELLSNFVTKYSVTNFSFIRNNYIHALAPCFISYNLFKTLHLPAWEQEINDDPETVLGKFYLQKFNLSNYKKIHNLTVITKHKKHTENFFNMSIFNLQNSFYTYFHDSDNNIIMDNYIEPKDVFNHFNDNITFIRITCGFCRDAGRNYMKKHNLKKNGDNLNEFYSPL